MKRPLDRAGPVKDTGAQREASVRRDDIDAVRLDPIALDSLATSKRVCRASSGAIRLSCLGSK